MKEEEKRIFWLGIGGSAVIYMIVYIIASLLVIPYLFASKELGFIPVADIAAKWANLLTIPYASYWGIRFLKFKKTNNKAT